MRRVFCLLIPVAALLATLVLSTDAKASVLGNLMSFDGVTDSLNDNSQAVIVDNDGDDTFSDGDVIYGVFEIEKVGAADPSPGGLFAIFSLTIKGAPFGTLASPKFDLVATAASDPFSVQSLLDDALEPGAFSTSGADFDDAIFALVGVNNVTGLGTDASLSPFDTAHTEATADLIIKSTLTAANGYSLEMIGGLFDSDDFFQVSIDPDAVTGGLTSISAIRADDNGVTLLKERAGMTVLHHGFGPSVTFLPVNALRFSASGTTPHDIIIQPDASVQTTDLTKWDVVDDANFKINATPEPVTSVVWLVLGSIGAAGAYRRRRQKLASKSGVE